MLQHYSLRQPRCTAATAPCVPSHTSRSSSSSLRLGRAALSTENSGSTAPTSSTPPRAKFKLHVDRMFQELHEEMVQRNLRVIHAKTLLTNTYTFRQPDDVWAVMSKDDVTFGKSPRVAQTKEWLGDGIFSQLDPDKHAAARATLNPAFRRDYIAHLDSFMVASAQQLADILILHSAAPAGGVGAASGAVVDMQRLFRLLTLDTIGLTSLNQSFNTLTAWQQQQQAGSGSGSSSSQLELERLLWDLESAFLWQSLRLPVPRSWLPGWSKYIRACKQLDEVIYSILTNTRAQQQQQQHVDSTTGSTTASTNSRPESPPGSRQTLVSFLLSAQQQQGQDSISDQQICDEIKTVMFGGTDTSAFTLAVSAHHLAQQPAAAERAAAEVAQLLQDTGRSGVQELRAEDAVKLPWVQACVNETMRLAPAGPAITRTALQDTELAGYAIPQGMTVTANLFAMHRHPDVWPQPDAWLPQRWLPAEAAAAGLSTRSLPGGGKEPPFLPFSTGPRGCIGRNYGLLQMVLTLAVLLGRGVRFELPPQGQGRQLEFVKSMTMHAKDGVRLLPRARG